jgi:hypothetical protein
MIAIFASAAPDCDGCPLTAHRALGCALDDLRRGGEIIAAPLLSPLRPSRTAQVFEGQSQTDALAAGERELTGAEWEYSRNALLKSSASKTSRRSRSSI